MARKLLGLALIFTLLLFYTVPAVAADPQISKQDLKGISPKRHRYLFSIIGGAAVGAGAGALVGGAGNVAKGIFIGGGGLSALYLHSHPHDNLGGWRNWAFLGSYSAFGAGLGGTLCGCNRGFWAGMLVGGGAAALKAAAQPSRRTTSTASTQP